MTETVSYKTRSIASGDSIPLGESVSQANPPPADAFSEATDSEVTFKDFPSATGYNEEWDEPSDTNTEVTEPTSIRNSGVSRSLHLPEVENKRPQREAAKNHPGAKAGYHAFNRFGWNALKRK